MKRAWGETEKSGQLLLSLLDIEEVDLAFSLYFQTLFMPSKGNRLIWGAKSDGLLIFYKLQPYNSKIEDK